MGGSTEELSRRFDANAAAQNLFKTSEINMLSPQFKSTSKNSTKDDETLPLEIYSPSPIISPDVITEKRKDMGTNCAEDTPIISDFKQIRSSNHRYKEEPVDEVEDDAEYSKRMSTNPQLKEILQDTVKHQPLVITGRNSASQPHSICS